MSWEGILTADGWSFIRTRQNAQDWRRPGKKSGSLSATVNYGESGTLRVFTSSADPLKHDSSYDKFAYLCCMKFDDDPVKAAFGLCPDQVLKAETDDRPVDLSWILGAERTEDFDDEEFCRENLPKSGLIREVFDYYWATSHRSSAVMGLAVAVSLCQTIFGRRVTSQTDLRTNDYNVIIAPTSSGKEACETTISKILLSADAARVPMIPPDVQSGNGLVHAIAKQKYAIWVCDEFGKTLEAVLDKKASNAHAKQIGIHLLKLYESGLPAWAVMLPSYGLWYRPWLRRVVGVACVAVHGVHAWLCCCPSPWVEPDAPHTFAVLCCPALPCRALRRRGCCLCC
jgi:hypothetical protein